MADRNVKVVVRADVADFLRGAGLAESATRKMGEGAKKAGQEAKTGLSGMAQSVRDNRDAFGQVGGGLTAYGTAVAGITALVAKTGIEYNTLRQRSGAALTTLTGSAEEANAQMAKLDDFASNSPFARSVFIEAQQQMFGFGIEAQKVIPYLDAIQNAVAATGGTNNDIAELSTIFSQISASAKITGTDLREFGNRGIDAATIIGSQMGKTGAQIREDITAGTLDAQVALDALAAGMQVRFDGAADNVKNTMLGAVDRVKAAFRDLSSDLLTPLVDPTGGGLAVDGLNRLADALRAFQGLPDGVKQTAGALGLLSGAASLGGGAFLLLAPRVVDTVDALRDLRVIGPDSAGALGKVGKAASGAAIGFAAVGGLSAIFSQIRESAEAATPGVEGFTSALLDVAESGSIDALDRKFADLGIQVNGLSGMAEGPMSSFAEAFQRVTDPTPIQRLEDMSDGLIGLRTSGDEAAEEMATLDAAVAGLVSSGHPEEAAQAFDVMWLALTGGDMPKDEFLAQFPQYAAAMQDVENQARLTADAASSIGDSLIRIPQEQIDAKIAALEDSLTRGGQAFIDFGEGLEEGVSLEGWLSSIESQIAAMETQFENAATLRAAGVNDAFISKLTELGPQGAVMMQEAVDAIADGADVSRYNEIGRKSSEEYAQGLAAGVAETVPPEVQINLDRTAAEQEYLDFVTLTPERLGEMEAEVQLRAEDELARLQVAETVLWAAEQTGIMNLDADDFEARFAIDNWNGIAANTTGLTQLDSDPAKALSQVRGWVANAQNTVATSQLDADASAARGEALGWAGWASSLFPTAKVGANDFSARGTVNSLIASINSRFATVNVTARYAGGLNMGGAARTMVSARAVGGVERRPAMGGPGYGKQNLILWGEPETRGEAFISNHPRYRNENIEYLKTAASWFGLDVIKAYAAGGVAQRYSMPSPSYSPAPAQSVDSGVTAQLASLSAAVASIPDRIVVPVSVGSRPVALASREGEAALGARSSWGNGKRLVT